MIADAQRCYEIDPSRLKDDSQLGCVWHCCLTWLIACLGVLNTAGLDFICCYIKNYVYCRVRCRFLTRRANTAALTRLCKAILDGILLSDDAFPPLLRLLLFGVRRATTPVFPEAQLSAVGGIVFLRFITPALVAPSTSGTPSCVIVSFYTYSSMNDVVGAFFLCRRCLTTSSGAWDQSLPPAVQRGLLLCSKVLAACLDMFTVVNTRGSTSGSTSASAFVDTR